MSLLTVRDLRVRFDDQDIVRGVDFAIAPGAKVGLIGESGSGKSLTVLSMVGLLPPTLQASGSVTLNEHELLGATERDLCSVRGRHIGLIFQEPMRALNPAQTVGRQIEEALRIHGLYDARGRRAHVLSLIEQVELPTALYRSFPHQLSGGQRQRILLAIAVACRPALLIADEPTTALDVTVQAHVLTLMERMVDEGGSALLLVTHDLAVVSQRCDSVLVMYGGKIVEQGRTADVFSRPRHPYTRGLLDASPGVALARRVRPKRLPTIPGQVPSAGSFPAGCPFRDRCPNAAPDCANEPGLEPGLPHSWACFHPVQESVNV